VDDRPGLPWLHCAGFPEFLTPASAEVFTMDEHGAPWPPCRDTAAFFFRLVASPSTTFAFIFCIIIISI
jgi:hypothetical protein